MENEQQPKMEVINGKLVAPSPLVLTPELCARCGINVIKGRRIEDKTRNHFPIWAMTPVLLVLLLDFLPIEFPRPWGSVLMFGALGIWAVLAAVTRKKVRVSYTLCDGCLSLRARLFGLCGAALLVIPVVLYAGYVASVMLVAAAVLIAFPTFAAILWLIGTPLKPAHYDRKTDRFIFLGVKSGAAERLVRASQRDEVTERQ